MIHGRAYLQAAPWDAMPRGPPAIGGALLACRRGRKTDPAKEHVPGVAEKVAHTDKAQRELNGGSFFLPVLRLQILPGLRIRVTVAGRPVLGEAQRRLLGFRGSIKGGTTERLDLLVRNPFRQRHARVGIGAVAAAVHLRHGQHQTLAESRVERAAAHERGKARRLPKHSPQVAQEFAGRVVDPSLGWLDVRWHGKLGPRSGKTLAPAAQRVSFLSSQAQGAWLE